MGKNEKKLIAALLAAGYQYIDADDLYKQSKLPVAVVDIILKWLPLCMKIM